MSSPTPITGICGGQSENEEYYISEYVSFLQKSDKSKDAFYEELEQVFDHFPKYHMKMLLGDFNAKVGRENIFKPTFGQESLHQDSNDNGVRLVNFATSKDLVVKSTMFPHRNIHKYTWTSPDGKTHNEEMAFECTGCAKF